MAIYIQGDIHKEIRHQTDRKFTSEVGYFICCIMKWLITSNLQPHVNLTVPFPSAANMVQKETWFN